MRKGAVSVRNETNGTLQRLPFLRMKEAVLGKRYELSLVFVTPKTSRTWNRAYRGKDKPANVLSFPLGKHEGEIMITPAVARKEAKAFSETYPEFLVHLFIHGLLHLKGHRHGGTMEKKELALRRKFVPAASARRA